MHLSWHKSMYPKQAHLPLIWSRQPVVPTVCFYTTMVIDFYTITTPFLLSHWTRPHQLSMIQISIFSERRAHLLYIYACWRWRYLWHSVFYARRQVFTTGHTNFYASTCIYDWTLWFEISNFKFYLIVSIKPDTEFSLGGHKLGRWIYINA